MVALINLGDGNRYSDPVEVTSRESHEGLGKDSWAKLSEGNFKPVHGALVVEDRSDEWTSPMDPHEQECFWCGKRGTGMILVDHMYFCSENCKEREEDSRAIDASLQEAWENQ